PPLLLSVNSQVTVSGKVMSAVVATNGQVVAGTERFLPGARVTFSPIGQAARPGRLRPGAVFAMSDSKGDYAIMVPRAQFEDGAVAVRATHPRFPLVAAYQASALPGLEQNFLLTLFKRVSKWDIIFALSGEAGPNAPPDVF